MQRILRFHALPKIRTLNVRCLTSSGVQDIEKQLEMFPEFKTANENFSAGKFQKAYPNYERVFESLQHSVGIDNPLTTHLLFQLANSHRYSGNFKKAESSLSPFIDKITSANQNEKLRLNELLSVVQLLNHQWYDALKTSEKLVSDCEKSNNQKMMSSVYGTRGISYLANGDLENAETFLQMSCRWAETPKEQMIAAGNNGALVWYKLANEKDSTLKWHLWDYQFYNINSQIQYLQSKSGTPPAKAGSSTASREHKQLTAAITTDSSIYQNHLVHTLNGWLEAVEDAQKGGHAPGGATACGPTGVNMTGMQDKDVTMIKAPKGPAQDNNGESSSPTSSFETSLANDAHFALAYSNLLFQLSQLYEMTGKFAESSDCLASAMKALNPHQENLFVSPFLGKVLRQVAYFHMCNMQAVTSEGLYRSAMEKLSSPFAQFDYRYKYDYLVIKGFYGKLMVKWDKREAVGEKTRKEALEGLKEWNQLHMKSCFMEKEPGYGGSYPLTSMIQFPIDFL